MHGHKALPFAAWTHRAAGRAGLSKDILGLESLDCLAGAASQLALIYTGIAVPGDAQTGTQIDQHGFRTPVSILFDPIRLKTQGLDHFSQLQFPIAVSERAGIRNGQADRDSPARGFPISGHVSNEFRLGDSEEGGNNHNHIIRNSF